MTVLPNLSSYQAPDPERGFDQEWSGYLTTENAEHIAAMLRVALSGKRYTWGEFNELFGTLQLDTGRVLSENAHDETGISCAVTAGRAQVAVCDSYGVWGLHSDWRTQPEWTMRMGPDEVVAAEWASRLVVGYSASFATRALHVINRVPEGHLTHWTIAVEGDR